MKRSMPSTPVEYQLLPYYAKVRTREAIDQLKATKKWLKENEWVQGYSALKADDTVTHPFSEGAKKCCLLGAITRHKCCGVASDAVHEEVRKTGAGSIVMWNDYPSREKKEVLQLLSRVIHKLQCRLNRDLRLRKQHPDAAKIRDALDMKEG